MEDKLMKLNSPNAKPRLLSASVPLASGPLSADSMAFMLQESWVLGRLFRLGV